MPKQQGDSMHQKATPRISLKGKVTDAELTQAKSPCAVSGCFDATWFCGVFFPDLHGVRCLRSRLRGGFHFAISERLRWWNRRRPPERRAGTVCWGRFRSNKPCDHQSRHLESSNRRQSVWVSNCRTGSGLWFARSLQMYNSWRAGCGVRLSYSAEHRWGQKL